jgi:ribonuclease P protein component
MVFVPAWPPKMAAVLSMRVAPRAGPSCLSDPIPLCPGAARFPRRVRLTDPADYQHVFKGGCYRLNDSWITLLAIPNQLQYPRLGLAISRKVASTAVARNRIKRVTRESFRHWQMRLQPLDIVVLGRNGISACPARDLDKALEKLWIKLTEKCAGSSSN